MQLWMSAEVDASVYEAYRRARHLLEDSYNARFANADYGAGVRKWAFIPILLPPEMGASYTEVQRHHLRRGVLEFRVKVDYGVFRASAPDDQVRLLANALERSLGLLPEMDITGFDAAEMARDFVSLAREQGWARAATAG